MLSTKAKNKIVKGILEDGEYVSKVRSDFLKIKEKYDESRQKLLAETEEVERAIREAFNKQSQTRAFKALSSFVQYDVEDLYDKAVHHCLAEIRQETGYSQYGDDIVEEFWNSSSAHC